MEEDTARDGRETRIQNQPKQPPPTTRPSPQVLSPNQQRVLMDENTRLKEQLDELQRQMSILQEQQDYYYHQQQQQQQQLQVNKPKKSKQKKKVSRDVHAQNGQPQIAMMEHSPPRYPRHGGSRSSRDGGGGGVLLELPTTFRKEGQNNNNPLCCSSRGNLARGQKDHQSISTTDDQDTIEPNMDLEAHQSAAGLHHRLHNVHNSQGGSNANGNLNAGGSGRTVSTVAGTTIASSLPHTNKSLEDSLSSNDDDDDDNDENEADGEDDDDDDDVDESDDDEPLVRGSTTTRGRSAAISMNDRDGIVRTAATASATTLSDSHTRPHEQLSFFRSAADRAGWLVGLLVFQSLSSFILARNEALLRHHAVIVQFLTMLVGAGGNAGNQASVGVVRGIAVGNITRSNFRWVLQREFAMGLTLSIVLGVAGFVRAAVFAVPILEIIAITSSLFMIVIISVVVGSMLPLGMNFVGIDPAHSSTTIQVIMDITGVVITVHVSSLVLDSDFHHYLQSVLSLDGETR